MTLVDAAKQIGFIFLERTSKSIRMMNNLDGKIYDFEILDIIEFNPVRRRMSVIVKVEGKIILYTKGADEAILSRLDANPYNNYLKPINDKAL